MNYKKLLIAILAALIWIGCLKDTEPPTVKIIQPTDGDTISDTITIKVDASDNREVSHVEFYIAETIVSNDTLSPWKYLWNPTQLPDSTYYKIVVKAYDPADNMGADSIRVFVNYNQSPYKPLNPSPPDGAENQPLDVDLKWICEGDPEGDPVTYDVYFGTSSVPLLDTSGLTTTTYDVGVLAINTTYYWKIVVKDDKGGETWGPVWRFKTIDNRPPHKPRDPFPPDKAVDQPLDVDLKWICDGDPDKDPVTYDVYFGTTPTPPLVTSGLKSTRYDPGPLKGITTYYWKIVVKDGKGGVTEGDVWSFTTKEVELNYDDGRPEMGWVITTENPGEVEDNTCGWCVRFTPHSYPFTLTKVKFFFVEVAYDFYLHVLG